MSFKLTSADKAKLVGVHPDLVRVLERAAELSPFPFRITEGLRTYDRQKKLVKAGASKTLNSRHLTGHAVDLVPLVDLDGNGKFDSSEIHHWPLYHKLAPTIKQAAKDCKVPIEWGGDWKNFKDGPHWQLPFKQYPANVQAPGLLDETPYTDETEAAAKTKDTAVTSGLGGSAAAGALAPSLQDIVGTLSGQQTELTSGDWLRIAIAAVIVAVTIYAVYRRLK